VQLGSGPLADIRVFDLSARRYKGLQLSKCFKRNEEEKKRHYNERVNLVEYGTFSPLVFSTNGGMARECHTFYKRLSGMLAEKRGVNPSNDILPSIENLVQLVEICTTLYSWLPIGMEQRKHEH